MMTFSAVTVARFRARTRTGRRRRATPAGRSRGRARFLQDDREWDGSHSTGGRRGPHRQRAGRKTYRALYSARRSWLTTGRTPTATRRPVPLDVLVAGAEPD